MTRSSGQTKQQKELQRISIERERQLRIENARQTTKAFSDNLAFRQKLRGIFSLLSGGFEGFGGTALGVTPGGGGAGGVGGFAGSGSGAGGMGGGQPTGGRVGPGRPRPDGRIPRRANRRQLGGSRRHQRG